VLGHELAGFVAAVGAGVTGVPVGARITTETDAYVCLACAYCRAGDQHLCPRRTAVGTSAPGGFAEYVAVPAAGVHRLPANVDFAAGALTEPLAVAVRAVVERAAVRPDEEVVVIGPGTIGLLVAQVAVARGAVVTVAGLTRHGVRFGLAHELGIPRTVALDAPGALVPVAASRDGLGVDVVFECSGAPDMLDAGFRLLRKGGRVVTVAFTGGRSVPLDLDYIVSHELSLIASRGKRPTCFEIAIDLLEAERVATAPLITHRFVLDRWEEAFETAGCSGTKVVLDIGGA
jgi:L-iditol 2-dehydrogenase